MDYKVLSFSSLNFIHPLRIVRTGIVHALKSQLRTDCSGQGLCATQQKTRGLSLSDHNYLSIQPTLQSVKPNTFCQEYTTHNLSRSLLTARRNKKNIYIVYTKKLSTAARHNINNHFIYQTTLWVPCLFCTLNTSQAGIICHFGTFT